MLDVPHSLPQDSNRDDLKLLHLIWEPPAKVVGGLGVAGAALCDALEEKERVKVWVMAPSDRVNINLNNINAYQLDIDSEDALKLQESVGNQQDLVGIKGAVADFTREVSMAHLTDPEQDACTLVHAHDWMTAAAGVNVQRSQGVPLILHVHSTQVDREGAHAKGAVYQHEKWAMQQADTIIAVSDYTRRVITDHYDIPSDKIRVVRNASSSDEQSIPLTREGNVEREPVVMFAGRLVAQKYPEAAVEIMVGSLKRVKNARGVIAGGGDKLGVIRDLVKFKGMGDRIEVLGNVPQKNMHTIYDTAAVLILPSISEPFGLVAMEAARAGVAVMLSDRCGVSEVLKSAQVIELYQTNMWIDSLVRLLESSELRETQVHQQMIEVEGYEWSDAGDEVLEIVNEIVTRRASGTGRSS
ncbi:MAG: glycosyltransferase involved in cell wall biosynthesis [Cryomorphaceae bacterium]|jgi:glycosyltransferase involved in cell wall biosynthesis